MVVIVVLMKLDKFVITLFLTIMNDMNGFGYYVILENLQIIYEVLFEF